MDLRNCRTCGNVFNYMVGPIMCPACKSELEEKFQRVKEYIRENPKTDICRVSEACGVETRQIKKWLREERLEITSSTSWFLDCERCGKPIKSGKYCDKCRFEVMSGLQGMDTPAPKCLDQSASDRDKVAKMRFLSNNDF